MALHELVKILIDSKHAESNGQDSSVGFCFTTYELCGEFFRVEAKETKAED